MAPVPASGSAPATRTTGSGETDDPEAGNRSDEPDGSEDVGGSRVGGVGVTPLDRLAHRPLRPIWLCRLDANPWPCGEAKLVLLAAFADDRPGLLTLLSTLQREAEDHLTQLDSGRSNNLTDRFLSWARPPDR